MPSAKYVAMIKEQQARDAAAKKGIIENVPMRGLALFLSNLRDYGVPFRAYASDTNGYWNVELTYDH